MLQNSTKVTEKKRHGCLTAYLTVLIFVNIIALGNYLLGWLAPNNVIPIWIIITYSLFALFVIFCAIAIFWWRKWGVWGLCAVAVAGVIASLIQGELLITSIIILVVVLGILFWVLHIGDENKGWPQLK